MSRLCRLKSVRAYGEDGKWAYKEITQLREENEKLKSELAALKAAPVEQEPVAWYWADKAGISFSVTKPERELCVPLYTHPKEWVGLTDEEIETIRTTGNIWTAYDISKAVEAKLKEKNA